MSPIIVGQTGQSNGHMRCQAPSPTPRAASSADKSPPIVEEGGCSSVSWTLLCSHKLLNNCHSWWYQAWRRDGGYFEHISAHVSLHLFHSYAHGSHKYLTSIDPVVPKDLSISQNTNMPNILCCVSELVMDFLETWFCRICSRYKKLLYCLLWEGLKKPENSRLCP